MKIRQQQKEIEIDDSKQPEWCNTRSINDLTLTFSLTPNHKNILSDFLNKIGKKCMSKKLEKDNKEITILDVGCGQGKLLEEIINFYNIKGIGISKYNEQSENIIPKKGIYKKYTIKNQLPENIQDNSLDFIISLYTLQYIEHAPNLINNMYQKLKDNGIMMVSLGIPGAIDPKLLYYIEKHNKDIIIDSIFTGNVQGTELKNISYKELLQKENKDIIKYAKNSSTIHVLYIKKSSHIKEFIIPKYRSNKSVRYTNEWNEGPEYELKEENTPYKNNNNIHLDKLGYTFTYMP